MDCRLSSHSSVRRGLCSQRHAPRNRPCTHQLFARIQLHRFSDVGESRLSRRYTQPAPIIAVSGPLFSLLVGAVCWLLYQRRFRERPSGLAFLMMAMVGIYSFLGPLAGTALGGDFHLAFTFLHIPTTVAYPASAAGFIILPSFMYHLGRELLRWTPRDFSRAMAVSCTTLAPWLLGTSLILLLYWPLPRFLVGSTIGGSAFWAFAVLGAALGFPAKGPAEPSYSFTRSDLILAIAALAMVRLLVHGVRLAH